MYLKHQIAIHSVNHEYMHKLNLVTDLGTLSVRALKHKILQEYSLLLFKLENSISFIWILSKLFTFKNSEDQQILLVKFSFYSPSVYQISQILCPDIRSVAALKGHNISFSIWFLFGYILPI